MSSFLNSSSVKAIPSHPSPIGYLMSGIFAIHGSRSYYFFSHVHQTYSRIEYFSLWLVMVSIMLLSFQIVLSEEASVKLISTKIQIFLEHNHTLGMPFSVLWEARKAYLRG